MNAKLRTDKGEQLNRLVAGYCDEGKQTLEMQLPDGPSSDRHAWSAAAGDHGREVYRDDNNNVEVQMQRLVDLQQLAQREVEAGWQPPAVKFHDFLNALASAKMGKQPGSDGVVVEMVRALSWSTLLWLYLLFLVRLGGWETERPDAWREVVLTAIPKKSDKVGFRSKRYTSLLPVILKLNIRALQSAVRRERKPHDTNMLGYEPGKSTAGVTATLRQVLSKAAEWGVRAFVASADVEGAFDGIKHDDVAKALLQKGVHPESVCSLLRTTHTNLDGPRHVQNRRRRAREGPEPACVRAPWRLGGTFSWRKGEITSCRGTVLSAWQKTPVRRKEEEPGCPQG